MYNVSQNFIDAIYTDSLISHLTGVIKFKDGTSQNISDINMVEGSTEIAMQAVTGEVLEFGATVIGELKFDLRTKESRYKYYDATIELTLAQDILNDEPEIIPFGRWTISEAEKENNVLHITAYDNVSKTEVAFDDVLTDTPFNIVTECAKACKLELANIESFFNNLPNGTAVMHFDENSGCDTYRQVMSAVAQFCGCFIQADREGKIIFRQFSTNPNLTIRMSDRYSSKIADYICNYVSVSATGLKGTYSSTSKVRNTGLTMVLEDAPGWDYGIESSLQKYADNLMEYLDSIEYTPTEMETFGNPAMDCGDLLRIETTDSDSEVYLLVTSYTWKYHGIMSVTSVGANPYITGTDKDTSNSLRTLQREVDLGKIAYYPFTNKEDVGISEEETTVASVRFTANDTIPVMFQTTFQIDVTVEDVTKETKIKILDKDGKEVEYSIVDSKLGQSNLHIWYYYDTLKLDVELVTALTTGSHVVTLCYLIENIEASKLHTFTVNMSLDSGKAVIRKKKFNGYISGQGLASRESWDGFLEFTDAISVVPISGEISVKKLTDKAIYKSYVPNTSTFVYVIPNIAITDNIPVKFIEDAVAMDKLVTRTQTWQIIKEKTWLEMKSGYTW